MAEIENEEAEYKYYFNNKRKNVLYFLKGPACLI